MNAIPIVDWIITSCADFYWQKPSFWSKVHLHFNFISTSVKLNTDQHSLNNCQNTLIRSNCQFPWIPLNISSIDHSPAWKAIARNWLHIRKRSAPRRALQRSDGPRTTHRCRSPRVTNASVRGAAATQSTRQRPRGNPAGNAALRVGHWPTHDAMAPGIGRALNLFAAGKTVPGKSRRRSGGVNHLIRSVVI